MVKQVAGFLTFLVLLTPSVLAQPHLPEPGITPDSPFYFLDRAFDYFQPAEAVANERLAEIESMAEQNKTGAIERAVEGYKKAMKRRVGNSKKNAEIAEEVIRQSSHHIAILIQIKQKVPEEAQKDIQNAIESSMKSWREGSRILKKKDSERARLVMHNTLEEVMANTPEQVHAGLGRDLDLVNRERQHIT